MEKTKFTAVIIAAIVVLMPLNQVHCYTGINPWDFYRMQYAVNKFAIFCQVVDAASSNKNKASRSAKMSQELYYKNMVSSLISFGVRLEIQF